ncbi:helix-turn-helix domain-containing protein [Saccharopolyspora shandongensis]|uniref:helix-turn-helix domain-containing protein n=1 Tax=Saccharopolyspora shandongensis TaxID=418495 RepID=UPI0034105736
MLDVVVNVRLLTRSQRGHQQRKVLRRRGHPVHPEQRVDVLFGALLPVRVHEGDVTLPFDLEIHVLCLLRWVATDQPIRWRPWEVQCGAAARSRWVCRICTAETGISGFPGFLGHNQDRRRLPAPSPGYLLFKRTLTQDLDRIEFEPGTQIAERSAGTNGIGVATTTRRPSLVIGAEHYKQPWHPWACVAAPVIHPITRRVAGMVNIACRATDTNHLLLVAVRALVDSVTTALHEAATARQRRMLDAHLSMLSASAGPVVTLDRQTTIVEDEAAELGLDRPALWAAVLEAGPSASEIALADGLRARLYPVTPGRLEDGVVLVFTRGFASVPGAPSPGAEANLGPLEQAEVRVITETLAECAGNKSEAAARLGISRGTLYQRLRRYRLR